MRRVVSTVSVAMLAVLGAVSAGCALPTDDNAQVIAEEKLSPALQDVAPATIPVVPESQTRDFAYFLLEPLPESEIRVVRQFVQAIPRGSLLSAVEPMEGDGFTETLGADPAWVNNVNQYDIVKIADADGVATVFLRSLGSEPPDNNVLRDVAAQLVWTLTGDGVTGVLFNVNDAPQSVPTSTECGSRP